MRSGDSQKIVVEVVQRMMQMHQDENQVERSLIDTLYYERQRLDKGDSHGQRAEELAFYNRIQKKALQGSPAVQRRMLQKIIERFTNEVLGHFSPAVYNLASKAVPPALNLLLNGMSPLKLVDSLGSSLINGAGNFGAGSHIADALKIAGNTAAIQSLAQKGTVVLVPTHISNLDSILIGFGIDRLGLPPFTYGAGYNLFANKVMGYFMRNLGAYKVDRKKKAPIYKDVLKTYAGCSMEMGYHNLFFPGGTRSRSGHIESHLKKGLLGCGLDAYIHNLRAGKSQPDIFVVPCTLNYQLVLEAETLIEDYLKDTGQNRYIIDDDEFSRPKRIIEFVSKLFSLDSRIHFVFGDPLDVFGNQVDADGTSRDPRGRPIARDRYVLTPDGYGFDRSRDHEYTSELATAIAAAFKKDSVLSSTNLVCYSYFSLLKAKNPELDLYRLLRTGGRFESLPLQEFYQRLEADLGALRQHSTAGALRLDESLLKKDSVFVLNEALAHLQSYHRGKPLIRRGERLFHDDRQLLYYYQNRVASYGGLFGEGIA